MNSEFFGMRFLNIFRYNVLWLLIWSLFWYDYCFKTGTYSYKFFPGIKNIYNPTSTMCNFWLLLPFPEERLGASICLHPIWDFSNTFLIPSLKSLRSVFDKSFCRIMQPFCRVLKISCLFQSQLICQCHDICIPSSKIREEKSY